LNWPIKLLRIKFLKIRYYFTPSYHLSAAPHPSCGIA
jgi:hypothetical protein